MQKIAIALLLSLTPSLFGQNGLIVTVAGNGTTGTSGVGGLAVNASIQGGVICVDSADNIYIADRGNNRVLKVNAATGILTLVAGNGAASSAGDLGPAAQASLNSPSGVAVDTAGNLFIAEFMGNRVRRVDAATGIITTFAGNGVGTWAGDGGPAINGSISLPMGLALDLSGNLYIADPGNNRVRRVDAITGVLTTVAGTGVFAHAPDGTPAASTSLARAMAVGIDRQGDLLITETYAYAIRRVSSATGLLSTVAGNGGTSFNGDGGPATGAAVGMTISNVATDAAGNLYFTDGTGRVRRVDAASGIIITVAGSGAGAHGITSAGAGGGGGGGSTACPSGIGDNGPATLATLDGSMGVAFTSSGRLLISDVLDCRVRGVQLPSPLLYTNTGLTLAGQIFTAAVTPIGGSAIPTGTVQFMEYLDYGPPRLLVTASVIGGSATLDANGLTAGSHQVMAIYMGDGAYNGSGSTPLGVTGGGKTTPVMGANVPYPILVSTAVTIGVGVVGGNGPSAPTGTFQILEGATLLATRTLINSITTFPFQSSTTGVHTITVQYSGDVNYTSLTWTFPITVLVPSTLTLSADVNPANLAAPVTFTGTVSPAPATGTMAFYRNGGIWMGTSSMAGGTATLTVSTLAAGANSITATYSGDFVAAPATSSVLTETITIPTTLTLNTNNSPSLWGQPVMLTAAISPPGATGTVAFYDGATLLGSTALSGGSAALVTAQLPAGTRTLTAVYDGAGPCGPSTSPALTQIVGKATPVVTLTSSANPVVSPAAVVFTANVTLAAAGTTIQFLDGLAVLGSAPLAAGSASFSYSSFTPGVHSITAMSVGDANLNQATSAVLSQTVQAPTTITLSAPSPTTVFGQAVTFTASAAPAGATGMVQFSDGGTAAGSAPIVSGAATLTMPALSAGSHPMQASYNGDGIYLASASAVWTQTVNKAAASIALASSLSPATVGQSVVFTVNVSPASASGTVQFMDGAALLATVAVSGGSASLASATLSVDSHSVTAVYSGDANYNGVTSAVLTQTVAKLPSTTSVSAASGTIVYGQNVDLTASVTPASATGTVQFLDGATVLVTLPVSGGQVPVVTATNLTAGTHAFTAVYSGDANTNGSTSAVTTVTVAKAATTVGLSSSVNPAASGQAVIFTATLSPATATGNAQFLDGAAVIGTAAVSGGAASLSITLSAGSHSITAVYSGDANYSGATSAVVTQTVTKAPSTTAISASSGTIVYGQNVDLTASVTPATATGTVQFMDGATVLVTLPVSGGQVPTVTATNLTAGTHAFTAVYSGDANTSGSTSAVTTVTVAKAATTLGLTSSVNPSASGQAVIFTATLSLTTATGNVQFLDGAAVIGSVAISGGTASISTAALAAGSHSITAVYSGDANCNGVTSTVVTQTVAKAPSTTSVSASSAAILYGQNVDLTASVTPASATGTVQFLDGATVLVTLPVTGGTAPVVTATNLTAGTHAFTAVYSGDPNTSGSTSAVTTVTVTKAATTIGLTSSVNPTASGQAVIFTATLSLTTATGNVQFLDGAAVIGTVAISGGAASIGTAALAAGSHSITAVYSGDANCNGVTSTVVTQTVAKAPSTTSISASSGSILYGQSVLLTASVTPATASGTVQFLDGATALGTSTLSGGSATLTAANLAVGTHAITAVYSGDAGNSGSTSTVTTVTVAKAATTVGLGSSVNPAASGQAVVFTATLSPAAATGTVQFLDGATTIGAAAVSGGAASLSTAALAAGSHSITAVYSGDANYNGVTSAVVTQTVAKASTTTSVSASSGTISFGQSVLLTASVTPVSASGTVQFLDGATVLGTSTLSGGSATLTAANLAVGTHAITAVYSGDAGNSGSSSAAVTVTVTKAGTTVTAASSLNPSVAGQAVTFTATVTPASASGTVQFLDGATVIGTVALSGGSAAVSTSALTVGSHAITAVYAGNGSYNGATSGAVTQTVKAVTTTSLSTNKTTAVAGQTVTFTATVAPAAATGSVQFLDGAAVIGTVALSGGTAALAVSNLAVGSHAVTASYGGATGYAASTSAAVSVTITAAPPAAPSSLTATAFSSSQINLSWTASATSGVTYNVYASATSGFTPAVGNRIAAGVSATSYAHTGLAASTTRYYRVTAQNAAGESAASNQANATTQAPGLSCQVVYSVTTQWNVGFGTAITIKNTGSTPITGWQLTWAWAGNQQITQAWNSSYTQSGVNATLTNLSFNPTIAPGATLSGMGFNASYSGSNPAPTAFYVNGTRCQ